MAATGVRWFAESVSASARRRATAQSCPPATPTPGPQSFSVALSFSGKAVAHCHDKRGNIFHHSHACTPRVALGADTLASRHLRGGSKGHYSWVVHATDVPNELSGGGGGGNGGSNRGGSGGGSGDSGGEGSDGSSKDGSPSPESNVFSSLAASYLALLETHPIPTKSVTCLLLNVFADLFCQVGIEHTESIDWKRAGVLGAIGFFMVAPCLHFWYLGLSKVIKPSGTQGALTQLFLDQFIFSPISIATFFIVLLTMEGRPHEITTKLQQDWFPTTVANWKLWVPFQFINFRLVPQSLQVAMANIVGVMWTVYLSYASHRPMEK